MSRAPGAVPRLFTVMGSGEMAPTMTSVHAELFTRLGASPGGAVFLDTPFGFQENADELALKAVAYFRQSVGHDIGIASLRNTGRATPFELETFLARIAESSYIFAGPGSPTYVLRQWLGTPVVDALRDKLRTGGSLVFASAAAVGVGALALPVYEVYKVGEEPRWLTGLDVLADVGIHAAVVPHFNNAEGGSHDTRYCYMGLRRIRILEEQLPDGVDILGVDEHTAAIFDLDAGTVTIRGRGALTLRRLGMERRFEAGTTLPISALGADAMTRSASAPAEPEQAPAPAEAAPATPFMQTVDEQCRLAQTALSCADPAGVVSALLAITTELQEWSHDTLASDERDRARATVRRLLVQLGELAQEGAVDPRERIAPFVTGILDLRREARAEQRWQEADRMRDLLIRCGVQVNDTGEGTDWALADRPTAPSSS